MSWVLTEFCVDDACLPAEERNPGPDDGSPNLSYSYVVDVSDQPATYQYRVEITAPDGRKLVYDGDIDTTGNPMGGERCNPTSASASLIVDHDGQLATQNP